MTHVCAAILVLLLATTSVLAEVTLNGVTLPAVLSKDGAALVLNGAGIRRKLFLKVYVAGLYLPAKSSDADAICAADAPAAFRLVITSGVVNGGNMSDTINDGFSKSLKGNTAALRPRIDTFIDTFKRDGVGEGDVFDVLYVPGEGVRSYKNDKYVSLVPGLDFKKALCGIWLSDDPVDSGLKEGLLGR